LKIINDWLTNLYDYTSIFRSSAKPSSLNVMSVRFSADSIVAPSSINNARTQHTAMMNGQSNFNSVSSKMETQSLMDTQQHQGLLGTPDANNASYMSSDYQNNHQQHQEEQHLNKPNITSAAAAFVPSAQDLFSQLHEALALEPKYQPNLFLPLQSNVSLCFFSSITIIIASLYEKLKNKNLRLLFVFRQRMMVTTRRLRQYVDACWCLLYLSFKAKVAITFFI
jgi:hypothetical protein